MILKIRQANFALRVVRRNTGDAAIVYRRILNNKHNERLTRIGAISSLAFTAGKTLLLDAIRAIEGKTARLSLGKYHPLDEDWGSRVACYTLISSGLRDGDRLYKAAENLRQADGAEAAWWLGLLQGPNSNRPVKALRIMVEAVK